MVRSASLVYSTYNHITYTKDTHLRVDLFIQILVHAFHNQTKWYIRCYYCLWYAVQIVLCWQALYHVSTVCPLYTYSNFIHTIYWTHNLQTLKCITRISL